MKKCEEICSHIHGPWKLKQFRAEKYEVKVKKYVEIMKKSEGNMKEL